MRNAAVTLAALTACRSPGVILPLCAVPKTRDKLLWLVWDAELQGERWGDRVDLTLRLLYPEEGCPEVP